MASLLKGSAPSPYAVSVGKAMTPPDRSSETISPYAVSPTVSVRYSFTRGLYYGRMQYNAPDSGNRKAQPKTHRDKKSLSPRDTDKRRLASYRGRDTPGRGAAQRNRHCGRVSAERNGLACTAVRLNFRRQLRHIQDDPGHGALPGYCCHGAAASLH